MLFYVNAPSGHHVRGDLYVFFSLNFITRTCSRIQKSTFGASFFFIFLFSAYAASVFPYWLSARHIVSRLQF